MGSGRRFITADGCMNTTTVLPTAVDVEDGTMISPSRTTTPSKPPSAAPGPEDYAMQAATKQPPAPRTSVLATAAAAFLFVHNLQRRPCITKTQHRPVECLLGARQTRLGDAAAVASFGQRRCLHDAGTITGGGARAAHVARQSPNPGRNRSALVHRAPSTSASSSHNKQAQRRQHMPRVAREYLGKPMFTYSWERTELSGVELE